MEIDLRSENGSESESEKEDEEEEVVKPPPRKRSKKNHKEVVVEEREREEETEEEDEDMPFFESCSATSSPSSSTTSDDDDDEPMFDEVKTWTQDLLVAAILRHMFRQRHSPEGWRQCVEICCRASNELDTLKRLNDGLAQLQTIESVLLRPSRFQLALPHYRGTKMLIAGTSTTTTTGTCAVSGLPSEHLQRVRVQLDSA